MTFCGVKVSFFFELVKYDQHLSFSGVYIFSLTLVKHNFSYNIYVFFQNNYSHSDRVHAQRAYRKISIYK